MLLATLANSGFALLWKKSMSTVSYSVFMIFVGVAVLFTGLVSFLNSNQSNHTINIWWPLLASFFVAIFYLFYSKVLITQGISQAYPINAIGTIMFIALLGTILFGETLTIYKIGGLFSGAIAIWLLLK